MLLLLMTICMLCAAGTLQTMAAQKTNVVTSAKRVSGGEWVKTAAGRKYRYAGGTYARNVWLKINGKVYRFDKNGICETGWITYGGDSYYSSSKGQLYTKRWLTEDGDRYYFQENGVCVKYRWYTVGKKQYFFLKSGRQARNKMFSYKGKTYYVNKSGLKIKSAWLKKGGKLYYFGKDGARVQNKWVIYKGEYRYLGSKGTFVKNSWVGNYYVGADGTRLKNCVKDGYYLNASGKKVIKVFNGDYIFVGDSRMVGMKMSRPSANTKYVAKVGEGYSWLKKTGGVTLQYYLKVNPRVKVVLALGVNDLGNINSYISYYKSLIKKYPKTEFYILSVNPVEENAGKRYSGYVKNSEIRSFNKKLQKTFSSRYVDAFTYMWEKENGYETFDGLHYNPEVYQDLYEYIVSEISK